jgi:Tol biopolymer transport system component
MKKLMILLIIPIVICIGVLSGCNQQTTNQNTNDNLIPPGPNNKGKIAFVSSGNIHLINPDGTGEKILTEGYMPHWSPDGQRIAYNKVDWSVHIINTDGTNDIMIVDGSKKEANEISGWSSDGKKILFLKGAIVNTDGSNYIELIEKCSGAVFSPDGKRIAYIPMEGDYPYPLYTMNVDGTDKVKLAEDAQSFAFTELTWSPDGRKITYPKKDNYQFYVINTDGTNSILLGGFYSPAKCPSWSSDGSKVVYWLTGEEESLYVSNSDGTGKHLIASGIGHYGLGSPSWSPDGSKIVFGVGEEEGNIYTINADGTSLTNLALGNYPQWSPN